MRYKGIKGPIRVGRGGLLTDLGTNDIPDTHLIDAKNIIIQDGQLQKDKGSRRWTRSALASAIVALREWSPDEAKSYILVITRGGTIHRYVNWEEVAQITALATTDPDTLTITSNNAFIIEGGEESPSNNKKLFIFTKNNQIQVISGTATTYTTLSTPSADFTSAPFPRFGIIHRDRLWVFLDHRGYISTITDHEDFTGAGSFQISIFPGTGKFLQSAFKFKNQLFIFKHGGGVYRLIDTDSDTSKWYFTELTSEFGVPAHEAMVEIYGDLYASNDDGTLTTFSAVQEFGDVDAGDTFSLTKTQNYFLPKISPAGFEDRRAIFDSVNKIAYFIHRPSDKAQNNAIWKFDMSEKGSPKITLIDKDQINAIAILTVPTGVRKPFYGANDGYIYELGTENREIGLVHNPVAPLATLGSGAGSLDNAAYRFMVTHSDTTNESLLSAPSEEITVSDNGVNGKIELTEVPIDLTGNATERIIYGSKDGAVYLKVGTIANNTGTTFTANSDPSTWTSVTLPTLNTFNTAYEMLFQTPHLTMKHVDPRLDSMQKNWDFFEVGFIPTALHNVTLEYWSDGIYTRSRTFQVAKGPLLGGVVSSDNDFLLDTDRLDSRALRWVRFKLHGSGRAISFRFTNSGQMQNAIISEVNTYFKLSNEDQKAITSGRS